MRDDPTEHTIRDSCSVMGVVKVDEGVIEMDVRVSELNAEKKRE